MPKDQIDLVAVGDIILGENCGYLLEPSIEILRRADLTVGQLEVPYTNRDERAVSCGHVPESLQPLTDAGFDVMTLAGNHLADSGPAGIEDTMAALRARQIAYVGAGMNITEALQPLIVERKGIRVGFVNFNCVGPKETWAGPAKPGNAYVHVISHYELDHANPGGPPKAYTGVEFDSLQTMKRVVAQARSQCDILVAVFHKGMVHVPVSLLDYEYQVTHAAIDAGADLVIAHHAHIVKGIEFYKGKAIYHSLGNGFVCLPMEALTKGPLPENWVERRKRLFGFEPDPDYPTYPFHPEAKYAFFAKCILSRDKVESVRLIPCFVEPSGRPVPVGRSDRGQEIMAYLRKITDAAGLNARYEWTGDEIVATAGEG